MAAAGHVQSEEQFLCSICLQVFTDPVTIPCGHNFCKTCISEHWTINVPYKCPMCKKVFALKPELYINTFISEMVAQFRHGAQQEPNVNSSDQQAAEPGEVACDVCTGTKLKALKSCLVCLTSYCQTHLQPHLTLAGLKRHQLIRPEENLEDRMCRKHEKPLELFCKTDRTCICPHCAYTDHKNHEFVPLKDEYEEQKAEAEIQHMIHERQLKIQEIRWTVECSKNAGDREAAEGVEVFTALMESVQRSRVQLEREVREKQRITKKQAEDFIQELEQEIFKLQNNMGPKVEQLSGSEKHLNFVQRLECVRAAPAMKTWTNISVCPPSYEGTVLRVVSQLKDKLTEDMTKVMLEAELRRVRQYAVDLTLDPDTAHPYLILSQDGKQVHYGDDDIEKNLPEKPQRFSDCCCLLAKQSFSSGRFYFEVQVKGKSDWDVGVARESVDRKGNIPLSTLNGYWTIWLRNGHEYEALDDPDVRLWVRPGLQKVGVFVDYEEGVVSFYDVDSAVLIYSFIGCFFDDKLLPYFSPCPDFGGKNSNPLIITPVHTRQETHRI